MLIQYFRGGNFFDTAFYNPLIDDFDLQVISATSTRIVAVNPGTGVVTTFTGTGFPAVPVPPLTGTLTGFSMVDSGGNPLATVTNIAWGLQASLSAIEAAVGADATGLLLGLLSLQDITLDASAAAEGIFGLDFEGVTSDITVIGSVFADEIFGGQGSDTISPGSASGTDDEADIIHGSTGDDTIDYSDLAPGIPFSVLNYGGLSGPVTINLNALTNIGTVEKGQSQGTDTIIDVAAMFSLGFPDIYGTAAGDTFIIRAEEGSGLWVLGGQGGDTFNLTMAAGSGITIAAFTFEGGTTEGIVFNATTGVIANDGFGFTDTLNLTRIGDVNASEFGIMGTDFADNITGSAGRDRLRGRGGNDTIDGGDGFDTVQYNRTQMTSGVAVDLVAGTATGDWLGVAFTHLLSNVERINGTSFGDTITGNADANHFDAGAGNDTLTGGGGRDSLYGGGDDDTIIVDRRWFDDIYGGTEATAQGDVANFSATTSALAVDMIGGTYLVGGLTYALQDIETLITGAGRDFVIGSDGAETIQTGNKRDQIDAGLGDDMVNAGLGNDIVVARLGGDVTDGGGDFDTLDFSLLTTAVIFDMATGVSNGIGTHISYESVVAGSGNDVITGSDKNERIRGNAGNDQLNGGRGSDELFGLAGNDTLTGGAGDDTLSGGAFGDTFVFVRVVSAGIDTITDFGLGPDRLHLDDALWNGTLTAAQVVAGFASVVGGDVVFDFANRGGIVLTGVNTLVGLEAVIDII